MCSPRTWSFEPDETSNQLRILHPENRTKDQLKTAGQHPENRKQDQLKSAGHHPETRRQDQLKSAGHHPETRRQDQPDTRSQDQFKTTGQHQPDNKILLLESHCPAVRSFNQRKRPCCLKSLPGSKKSTHQRLISFISVLTCVFLLLAVPTNIMAEDEESHLVAVRREQEVIRRDAQTTKDKLLGMLDDPDYESLDQRRLRAIECKLDALLLQGSKIRSKLIAEEIDENLMDEDSRNWDNLEQVVGCSVELCSKLMATREVHAKILTADRILSQLKARRVDHPEKDYTIPVKKVSERVAEILEILDSSSLATDHKLRTRALELEIGVEDMEIVETLLTPDIKPKDIKVEPPKMQPLAPPTFSGKQKDWQAFWAAFRDIHECPKYSNTTKLCYLKQAQKDISLHQQLCENVSHGDCYDDVVKGLLDQFDRPREDHRIYLENITQMQPVKATRASLMSCATSLQSTVNGLNRLGQVDMHSILTTLVEPLLPEKVKAQWEQDTVKTKKVPAVGDLIIFLRERAAMPQYADKIAPQEPSDKRPYRPQQNRQKGFVHVVTNSPVQPQQETSESTWAGPRSPYPFCRYSCPLCEESHYAWACSAFKEKTLAAKREHVKTHKLCENCLKPGHSQTECNSRFSCQTCAGRHNTLLHSGNTPPTNTGVVQHITTNKAKAKLLMTCRVMIAGPTGRSMPVRALLDSGADTCSITSKVAKHLGLKHLKETVAITSFATNNQMILPTTSFQLSSLLKTEWTHQVMAVVVEQITGDQPREDAAVVKSWPALKNLTLADPQFYLPGRIDVLIGADVLPYVLNPDGHPSSITTTDTVFGHAIMGTYTPSISTTTDKASIQLAVQSTPEDDLKILRRELAIFWEMDNLLIPIGPYNQAELRALTEYKDTHFFNQSENRYQVSLPRRLGGRLLGESKTQALQRYFQNIKSLARKGGLEQFRDVLQEYVDLGHARLCTAEELKMPSSQCYYLPMFGVIKASSTTTKLRIVFDASAVSTSGWSLNDTLEAGPMLHPKLAEILIKFRKYRVALTGDVTKMYRQLLLTPKDQHFHRFFHQSDPDRPPQAYCMSRVTFGVTCSPFLAVRTLQQTATDFGKDYPAAQKHVNQSFYVDDLLGGADSIEEAKTLYRQLDEILQKGGFTLRKYRSSSSEVLDLIPADMKEDLPTKEMVDSHSESYPKALGVVWNSVEDTMGIDVSYLGGEVRSKRDILSDTFKTFDVMGWITPVVLPMKILIQELWKMKVEWKEDLPEDKLLIHQTWRENLPTLANVNIPRCYFLDESTLTVQLHGFADASEAAYGAVIYIRATYTNHKPTARLVTAKSRVAPIKQRTIPELELCGAVLLAQMMEITAAILDIPKEQVTGWLDSTIVLCWLRKTPSKYNTFVGNRIATATRHYPPSIWKHVPTLDNPADCASRGITAQDLKEHKLWWSGPEWLKTEPLQIPTQPSSIDIDRHQDHHAKASVCLHISAAPTVWLADRLSSYYTLNKVTAWILRAAANFKTLRTTMPLNKDEYLTVEELKEAERFLLKRSQRRSYGDDIAVLADDPKKTVTSTSNLLCLTPFLDHKGLMRVGGRLENSALSYYQKYPVILSPKDPLTILLISSKHKDLHHSGPTSLSSIISEEYYIVGVKHLTRTICKRCITCKKVAAKTQSQLMGQLPAARVTEAPAFSSVGIDFAGPFQMKTSQLKRAPTVKGYLCVIVCFSTKAVHLEVVTAMTTEAFLAALKRFTSRRGLPTDIYTDNGGNFRGAANDLKQLYQLLQTEEWTAVLRAFFLKHHISWHFIPERAPHFGGLWEAAVKSAKYHLKRVIGEQKLTYEEFSTIATQVEACLNSRPLLPVDSHSPDGIRPPTPGHALIGRPIVAYPETYIPEKAITHNRWTLQQGIVQSFWKAWSGEYFRQMQATHKWKKKQENLCVGDVVMMQDGSEFKTHWGLARVIKVFPGEDGLVRAVELTVKKGVIPAKTVGKKPRWDEIKVKSSTLRRPVSKLVLLIPAKNEGSFIGGENVQAKDLSSLSNTNLTADVQSQESRMPEAPAAE